MAATVVEINTWRKKAGLPLIRYNLHSYSDQDLLDLRHAFEALYEISATATGDARGFWAIARGHGYDQDLCHNDNDLFLTWHRAYVYIFEKLLTGALQWKRDDRDLVITLPYWNWAFFDPEKDAENGIPKALDDSTYVDPTSGEEKRNPLHSARSLYRVESLGLEGEQQYTQRYPTTLREYIPTLYQDIESYFEEGDFMNFSDDFNNGAHAAVHGQVSGSSEDSPLPSGSGDLSDAAGTAYDPIFFFHHSMVDRVWFQWQRKYGNSTVPEKIAETTVYGGFTGAQVIDAKGFLKYVYSDAPSFAQRSLPVAKSCGSCESVGNEESAGENKENQATSASGTLTLRLSGVGEGFDKARLHLHSMHTPQRSFELRVFIDQDDADAFTPTAGNERYAGSLHVLGHGNCFGAPGHCDPEQATRSDFDRRPGHPLRRRNFSLNVTRALKVAVERGLENDTANLSFVVLNNAGEQVDPGVLDFEAVSLVAD